MTVLVMYRDGDVSQWIKVLAAKLEELSLIPGTHMWK